MISGRVTTKPIFGDSDQVQHIPGCTAIKMVRGLKFRIKEEGEMRKYLCDKTKALISCVVTAQLIYISVFPMLCKKQVF